MQLLIINGPNLNLLGHRETEIYGNQSFDDFLNNLKQRFNEIKIDYFQSNIEGEIIDIIQKADANYNGIILNPAAYSYTSIAIADAIRAIKIPVVEVHISNIFNREEYRKHSLIAAACKGFISGFGLNVYNIAILYFLESNNIN